MSEIEHLLAPSKNAPALWHFGEQLALNDKTQAMLPQLTRLTQESKHQVCLHGYLSSIREIDRGFYLAWMEHVLEDAETAWLGATIALRSDYIDDLFVLCLEALEKKWIDLSPFISLRYGKTIEAVPSERARYLFKLLDQANTPESLHLVIELLDVMKFDDTAPFDSEFVLGIVQRAMPQENRHDQMRDYHWKNVCLKLVKWNPALAMPLLGAVLTTMERNYSLSYNSHVVPLLDELVRIDRGAAWTVVKSQFEKSLPQWRSDLLSWLKGGLVSFDEKERKGAIADLPMPEIIEWIEEDVESRAALVAHAAPGTLDNRYGAELTRELLERYGNVDGVCSAISATFNSGGWTGPTSAYLRRKREKLRHWLAAGYQQEVVQWIEAEIEYLDRCIEREEIDEERSRFD